MQITVYGMHGPRKLAREGLRTRDAHLAQTLQRSGHQVTYVGRPEPLGLHRYPADALPFPSTAPAVARLPRLRERRRWWVDTADRTPPWSPDDVVLAQNFLGAAALVRRLGPPRVLALDLLDDWQEHTAYACIQPEVERAYATVMGAAAVVIANGTGTAERARSHGRSDVHLVGNGVDPALFATTRAAVLARDRSPRVVGYVGKISERFDVATAVRAAVGLPDVEFVFVGPVMLPRGALDELRACDNVTLQPDLHYDRVPAVMATFGVAWVPHRTDGHGRLGGDLLKVYEYRAAGLRVVMPPLADSLSDLEGVERVDPADLLPALERALDAAPEPAPVPHEATWRAKADQVAHLLEGAGLQRC